MSDLPDTTTPDGLGTIIGAVDWSPLRDLIRLLLEVICQ